MTTPVFIEGWDDFSGPSGAAGLESAYTISSTLGGISLVAGHNGGQALRQAGSDAANMVCPFDSAVSSFTFVSFVRVLGFDTDRCVGFYNGTTEMISFRFSTDGSVGVYRGATLLGSSAAAAVAIDGVFHLMEMECVIDDSAGRITVYWDDVQIINLTAQDTRNGTPTTVDRIKWNPTASSTAAAYYDHTFVWDSATRPADQYYIETISVDADGATLNWTPSTGADHFAVVDELPASTADYLQASTVGNIDELIAASLSDTPTAILGAKVRGFFNKTDVTVREVRMGVKSGATTSAGTTTAITQTGTAVARTLLTDPDTAAAWTASGINALRLRPEVTV